MRHACGVMRRDDGVTRRRDGDGGGARSHGEAWLALFTPTERRVLELADFRGDVRRWRRGDGGDDGSDRSSGDGQCSDHAEPAADEGGGGDGTVCSGVAEDGACGERDGGDGDCDGDCDAIGVDEALAYLRENQ